MPGARSSALKAAAKKHSGVSRSAMAKSRVEKETDERRLEARRKEVERFENTANHERFRSLVPLSEHAHRLHPQPPDRTVKMSSRMWKLRMKTWRQCLHDYEEGRELPPPYVSARWVHLLSSANVGDLDDAKCLQPCGEALERRARELDPAAAEAELGPPAAGIEWSKARVEKLMRLLDRAYGDKDADTPASPSGYEYPLYELPSALKVDVASTAAEVTKGVQKLLQGRPAAIGLDTEWVPAPASPSPKLTEDATSPEEEAFLAGIEDPPAEERVTLLQLSSECQCVLVRLAALDTVRLLAAHRPTFASLDRTALLRCRTR